MELQGNSNRQKEGLPPPTEKRKKAERVVSGPVIRRKTPLRHKIRDTFFGGNPKEAMINTFTNTFVPRAKEVFLDTFYEGMDRMVLGEARPRNRGNGFQNIFGPNPTVSQYVPYNAFGSGQPTTAQANTVAKALTAQGGHAPRPDFGQIILPSKHEAEEVINKMMFFIQEYNFCSVDDLCDFLGITSVEFTDAKHGWNDITQLGVKAVSGGYLLVLPYPVPLG